MQKNNAKDRQNKIIIVAILIGLAAFFIGMYFSYDHTLVSASVLIAAALIIYIIFSVNARSFFDVKAIFSFIWLGTIGLACLRLNSNQKPWFTETWICFILTYVCFMCGCWLSNQHISNRKKKNADKGFKLGKLLFKKEKISENGFFIGIVILFAVVIISFLIQVVILRFIPLFSSDMNAYVEFHISGVGYLVVSCIFVFPYSYYYFKNYSISKKKLLFLIIINLAAFLIPMLIVSRQLYILGIILDMFTVISAGKRNELISFIVAAVVLVAGWGMLSYFRHQNTEYLSSVFDKEIKTETEDGTAIKDLIVINSKEIIIPKEKRYNKSDFNITGASRVDIKLPMPIYQVYMYAAFNYDNFNYNVYKIDRYSAGCKTLFPAIAISGIKFIVPALTNFPVYNYNANFTTNPGIYNSYYDFGVLGVVIFMLVIGFLANTLSLESDSNSITKIIYNSLMKYSLLFFFFTSFFSNATMAFYVILVAIIHVVISYSFVRGENHENR